MTGRTKFRMIPLTLFLLLSLLLGCLSGCGATVTPAETGGGSLRESETEAQTSPIAELESRASGVMYYADFFRVGKADAILLRSGSSAGMIDAGETDDAAYLVSELSRLGVTRLDFLILTHFDNDHIGAVPRILDALTVDEILAPDYARDSELYRTVLASAESHGVSVTRLSEDRTVAFGTSALKVWTSATEAETDPDTGCLVRDEDDNAFSLICEWTCGSVRMLFLADAEKDRLTELMETRTLTVYGLIKLPHHGSYSKPLQKLLNRTVPKAAVSCVDNLTAMDGQLTDLLSDMGVRSFLTCDGTVRAATDGSELAVEQ